MNPKPLKPKQVVHFSDEVARKIANGLNDEVHLSFYRRMVKKYPVSSINKAYDLTRKFQEMTKHRIVPHEIFKLVIQKHPPNENERDKYQQFSIE